MELNSLTKSNRKKIRVGRGIGSGKGKTSSRGHKGQKSRSGVAIKSFEGGQMPLKQRVPKLKGFNNPFRVEYSPVNLHQLEKLGASTVDVDALVAAGLVRKGAFVKVLGYGDLSIKVSLSVHAISAAARSAVEAAGGDVTIVPLPHEGEGKAGRPAVKGNQFANR